MPRIDSEKVYQRFLKEGANSGHFVWFLTELSFFEASNGWIFAYLQRGETLLLPHEPLIPGVPSEFNATHLDEFKQAWSEFRAEVPSRYQSFVAVYSPFAALLGQAGFQCVEVGREPWVDLKECIPRGNAGRGVRSARNQALRAGVQVEDWKETELASDPVKKETVLKIFREWKSKRLLDVGGFLNSVDPVAHSKDRRYFIAKLADGSVQGVLIATPVPGARRWFLEDLMLGKDAARGTAELLTLEALVSLQESSFQEASLGVVSVTNIDPASVRGLPFFARFIFHTLPNALRKVYNFDGLETFRSRFKPHRWDTIHLAVGSSSQVDSQAWSKVMFALFSAFRPRFQISARWFAQKLARPFFRYPVTSLVTLLSFALFATINRFGELPHQALDRFGFTASAPVWEWPHRSLISDYLYFNPVHFWVWGTIYFLLLRWAERTHSRKFVVLFFGAVTFLDDFINYACVLLPFHFLQPSFFHHLVNFKDVGGSLGLVTFLGLQICQIRRGREILFTIFSLGLVFGFVFSSYSYTSMVLNLNHFLFLSVGFIAGKLEFEWKRKISRQVCRGKPPEGRTVLPCFDRKLSRKAA